MESWICERKVVASGFILRALLIKWHPRWDWDMGRQGMVTQCSCQPPVGTSPWGTVLPHLAWRRPQAMGRLSRCTYTLSQGFGFSLFCFTVLSHIPMNFSSDSPGQGVWDKSSAGSNEHGRMGQKSLHRQSSVSHWEGLKSHPVSLGHESSGVFPVVWIMQRCRAGHLQPSFLKRLLFQWKKGR